MIAWIPLTILFVFAMIATIVVEWEEDTKGGVVLILFALTAGGMYWYSKEYLTYVLQLVQTSGFYVWLGVYLLIGIFWSFFRWYKYVKIAVANLSYDYRDRKSEISKAFSIQPGNNIGRLTTWIFWWPFSLMRYVFGELCGDLVRAIVNKLSFVYDSITKSIINKQSVKKEENV